MIRRLLSMAPKMSYNIDDFNLVKEGMATILAPKQDKVFYNPIQQFNRDLSIMCAKAWLNQYQDTKERARELRGKKRNLERKSNNKRAKTEFISTEGSKGDVLEDVDSSKQTDTPSEISEKVTTETREGTEGTEETKESDNDPQITSQPKPTTASSETSDANAQEQVPLESKPFVRILEALSATGLRAIRYAHEVPQVQTVVANDLLTDAVQSIERSAHYNNLSGKVVAHEGDAIKYMGSLDDSEKFHVVDLDPYGTAAPFLDSALQLIKDNGLLMVTCTDAGVLAGNGYPEKCFALYGGNNFGNTNMGLELNHEAGLRLILGSIAQTASKYKKAIEPVLSLSIDYYFRVFVRVSTSPLQVKQLAAQTMLTYHCVGCGQQIDQRLGRVTEKHHQTPRIATIPGENCQFCDRVFHLAGPYWGGALHNPSFVDAVLEINREASPEIYKTRERIKGMLTLAKNELPDVPFYFNLNQLCSLLKAPPLAIDDFAKAVGNLGYRISLTHAKKNCVKTDAPWEKVLGIGAAWLKISNENLLQATKQKLEKETEELKKEKLQEKMNKLSENLEVSTNLTQGMVGHRLLETVPRIEIDMKVVNAESEKIAKLRKVKMVRYQENPTKNWGPKSRPKD